MREPLKDRSRLLHIQDAIFDGSIRETEFLMRSPAMMEAIRQGERDIAEGRYVAQQEGESIKDFLLRQTL